MSWDDYVRLARANPELATGKGARKCYDEYHVVGLSPDSKIYAVPVVDQDLPRRIHRLLKENRATAYPCPDDELPVQVVGSPRQDFTVFWNRCPGAFCTHRGWISIGSDAVDVLCFLRDPQRADDLYKDAITFAAVWNDNHQDMAICKVKVYIPSMNGEWQCVYEPLFDSDVLRDLKLPGQTMWRVNDEGQFIAFDGENGGWFDPQLAPPSYEEAANASQNNKKTPQITPVPGDGGDDDGGEKK